jgi:hypothetical protein
MKIRSIHMAFVSHVAVSNYSLVCRNEQLPPALLPKGFHDAIYSVTEQNRHINGARRHKIK